MADDQKVSVLFVCLGNICRSTMAEGILKHLTSRPEYKDLIGTIDSCGTGGYHTGDEPDERTMRTLRHHGITSYVHYARKISPSDFDNFDYIFGMDRNNIADILRYKRYAHQSRAKVMLFGEFSGTGRAEIMEDPYYGGKHGFDLAYEQCMRFAKNFLKETFPDVKVE